MQTHWAILFWSKNKLGDSRKASLENFTQLWPEFLYPETFDISVIFIVTGNQRKTMMNSRSSN